MIGKTRKHFHDKNDLVTLKSVIASGVCCSDVNKYKLFRGDCARQHKSHCARRGIQVQSGNEMHHLPSYNSV